MTLLWNLRIRVGAVAVGVLALGGVLSLMALHYLLSQVEEQKEEVIESSRGVLQETYDQIIKSELRRNPAYAQEEDYVRGVARRVGSEVMQLLVRKYGNPNTVSDEVIMQDEELKRVAVQWVERNPPPGLSVFDADDKRRGYTTLYVKEGGRMLQHAQEKLIGQRLAERAGKAGLLNWWRIYGGAIKGEETSGYYLWTEADGSQTVKFMVCSPIPGTRFIVAATMYMPNELTTQVLATVNIFEGFEGHVGSRLRGNLQKGFTFAMSIALMAAIIMLLLLDVELRSIATHQQQIERYWKISKTTDLASTLWHDLKNDCFLISVTINQTMRYVKQKGYALEPELHSRLKNIIERVARLESQAKYFERKPARDPKPVNLKDLIESVITPHMSNTGVTIKVRSFALPQQLVVPAEEMDLKILFNNIIKNAVQACEPTGKICIDLNVVRRNWRKYVQVIVRDSGPGFASIKMATEPGHSDGGTGRSGMGLPIAERTILEHRGFLELRNSKNKNWGAEVIVGLPYYQSRLHSWLNLRGAHNEQANGANS